MWGTRVGALDSEADPLSRMWMHSALRLGSVEYSGYLDLTSGVYPSMREMGEASETAGLKPGATQAYLLASHFSQV